MHGADHRSPAQHHHGQLQGYGSGRRKNNRVQLTRGSGENQLQPELTWVAD